MPLKAVIAVAGAQGCVILDILRAEQLHQIEFADETQALWDKHVNVALIDRKLADVLRASGSLEAILVLGNPVLRTNIAAVIREQGPPLTNAVHPSLWSRAAPALGEGNRGGRHRGYQHERTRGRQYHHQHPAVMEHDCNLAEGSDVSPGAHLGGRVTLGCNTFVATGAIVLSRVLASVREMFAFWSQRRRNRRQPHRCRWAVILMR